MKQTLRVLLLLLTTHCSLLTALAQGTPGTVRYPGAIDTVDSLFGNLTDGPQTALSGTISSSATTITVVASGTTAFGSSGSLKIDNETLYYTGKSSNQFTGVLRGRDGSTATSHVSGAKVSSPILSVHHRTLGNALIAVETDLASIDHSLGSGDIITALGYTPMRGSNNLSEIVTPGTARSNLGLGSMATQSAGNVVITGGAISNVTCTACVGSVSGTGGVDNPDTTVIGAANQSVGDTGGFISFKTRQTERFQVGNTGNFGIGGTSTGALFDIFTLPTHGAQQVFNLRTNEAGSGDFSTSFFATAGSNGETRKDNQTCEGYNVEGPGYVAGEHSFFRCTESRFKTAGGVLQLEDYTVARAGSESSVPGTWRPYGMTFRLTDSNISAGFNVDHFGFQDKDAGAGQAYFSFDMDATAGVLTVTGDSYITNFNLGKKYLRQAGHVIAYIRSDLAPSFGPGGFSHTIRFMEDEAPTGDPAILVGSGATPPALRFQGSSLNRFQFANDGVTFSNALLASDLPALGAIGGTTPAAGAFTTLSATTLQVLDGSLKSVTFAANDSCGTGFKCLRVAN